MSVEGERQAGEILGLHQVYIAELREHALALVWLGYQRMELGAFAVAEEDDITGELVGQMKSVIEDETAPPWANHYSIVEQVRSNATGKFGKRRPIVDVEFERHKRGPRPRLRFEAKRLCRSSGASDYLGDEGLGVFPWTFQIQRHPQRERGEIKLGPLDLDRCYEADLPRANGEMAWHRAGGRGRSSAPTTQTPPSSSALPGPSRASVRW
jgi:hypothetical protein